MTAQARGHHFLIRLTQDRQVFLTQRQEHLEGVLGYARALPSRGQDVVDVPGKGGRPPRRAVVQLAAAPVWIPAPLGTPDRWSGPVVAAWVIRVWEADPPAGVEEPLEWLLVCSLPTASLAQVKERRDWYGCRWLAELFHDVEKNGCREEARRLETAQRLEACLAVLAVVAVRVLQLRAALHGQPEASADQVASAAEQEVLRRLLRHGGERLTVRELVRGVAKLGGFLGRRHDGEPGIRALWRGYQRLQDVLAGFQLHAPPNLGHDESLNCW